MHFVCQLVNKRHESITKYYPPPKLNTALTRIFFIYKLLTSLFYGNTQNIPSCSVVCSNTVVNGPVPAVVNAATLQRQVLYGCRSETVSDVEVMELYCNLVPVLTAVIVMLYPRTSPFWCSSGGGFQESRRLLESSTTTVRFPGGAVGTI